MSGTSIIAKFSVSLRKVPNLKRYAARSSSLPLICTTVSAFWLRPCVLSSFAIIKLKKRELVALL